MDTLPKIKTQSNAKNKIMRAARMLPFLFPRLSARMSSRYSTGGFYKKKSGYLTALFLVQVLK
jgi:hypothetical protein